MEEAEGREGESRLCFNLSERFSTNWQKRKHNALSDGDLAMQNLLQSLPEQDDVLTLSLERKGPAFAGFLLQKPAMQAPPIHRLLPLQFKLTSN